MNAYLKSCLWMKNLCWQDAGAGVNIKTRGTICTRTIFHAERMNAKHILTNALTLDAKNLTRNLIIQHFVS